MVQQVFVTEDNWNVKGPICYLKNLKGSNCYNRET
jgi:hypothetical protein